MNMYIAWSEVNNIWRKKKSFLFICSCFMFMAHPGVKIQHKSSTFQTQSSKSFMAARATSQTMFMINAKDLE